MLRLILLYSSSAGLQRGIAFLAIPLLARHLGLSAIGEYTLTQTIVQLAGPVLTLNCLVALTREAIEAPREVRRLFSILLSVAAATCAFGLLARMAPQIPTWLSLGVALGGTEVAFMACIAVLQGREAAPLVVTLASLKSAGFAILVGLAILFHWSLAGVLQAQLANSLLAAVAGTALVFHQLRQNTSALPDLAHVRKMFGYSIITLPHTAALWLSVSSDRLLLGAFRGTAVLGAYSIAYTIAQFVLLFTSGIITALPPRVARDPENWRRSDHVIRFCAHASAAIALVLLGCLAGTAIDRHWTHLLPAAGGASIYINVALIGLAFHNSIYYVLFSSYLFLNRNADYLFRNAFIVAPFNFAVMVLLIYLFGAVGAAAGLFVSYSVFGIAYARGALLQEPGLWPAARKTLQMAAGLALATLAVALLLSRVA
jgi:O-antigen/teichoic acid export membrane protein